METVIYRNNKRYTEKRFRKEDEFEKLIVENAKTLFGQKSIFIDAKKKIENSTFGGVIPDGFLFDLNDILNPEFYIVEVELSKHSFFNHILPQITKFFAFFKKPDSQGKLIEKIYDIFNTDTELRQELKTRIGRKEIFKYLKDTIENSQNILMIIDGEKQELPDIMETYTDTWGKMVKVTILKEYLSQSEETDSIITLSPDFENIENIDIVTTDIKQSKGLSAYTEEFHLDGVTPEIKKIYEKLKEELISYIPNIEFNPQRYYVSLRKKRNFAFLKIRKKKIVIIAKMQENKIRERIKSYDIHSISERVQQYYNGPCARIDVTDSKNLEEVVKLLIEIQK